MMRPSNVAGVLRALCGLFLVACSAAGCGDARSSAPPVAVERSPWNFRGVRGTELQTAHYLVRTTCTHEPLLERLPEFLEGCWAAYGKFVPPLREPQQPAMTYLFQTRQQWELFTQDFSPARASTYLLIRSGGYEERGVTVSHYARLATTLSLLAHEGLHQFLSVTRGGILPAWVNEGLACCFEAVDIDDRGRPRFRPRDNYIRRNSLRDAYLRNEMFDLSELLATNAGRVVAMPTPRVRSYYAQTWSLVLMLLEADGTTAREAEGFRELLRDLGTDRMRTRTAIVSVNADFGEQVFRAYVTDDFAGFKDRYGKFVRKLLELK